MGQMCAKGGRVRAVCHGPHAAPYIWKFLYRGGKRRTLCDASTKRREQRAARRRQTPRDRGYNKAHVAERKRKLPAAYGQICKLCHRVMVEGEAVELDHILPVRLHGPGGPTRIVHARCNSKRGPD